MQSMKKIIEPSFSNTLVEMQLCDVVENRTENALFQSNIVEKSFAQVEFYECEFKHVTMHGKMQGCLFVDVIFEHCDLSNTSFEESVFRRCVFRNCRMTGIDMSLCTFTDVQG